MDTGRFFAGCELTHLLVVGDVMVDAYLWGRVDRISPEAPVPVVQVTHRSARLGGAANVALNARALRAKATIATVIGDDADGDRIESLLREQNLPTDGIVRSKQRRTTVKTRVISGHQHVVRVDEEQEDDLSTDDGTRLLERIASVLDAQRPDAIVLEDYNKGVLTEAVITGVIRMANEKGIPVAVDPKKKNFLAYQGVDLFKPNLKELREGLKTDVDPTDDSSMSSAVNLLEEKLSNRMTLVTLSEHGAFAHDNDGPSRIAAHKRKIVDVSGAGDTVIAVAAMALAQGLDARGIAALSNLAGGLVCEEAGVVPIDLERFKQECERLQLP
ncbi:MAG: D-glycero-beta-D-manno-heptose-7-phosphate kinase [Flavobacteriales bacterium]|nr:D-glycero-beta-D-manno-heptose-7-phosphate kinase [Flavobacteriales bacterium]